MDLLARLFGRREMAPAGRPARPAWRATPPPAAGEPANDQALERYRYMIRTAPPETIEQAHAEAFARLTPEQRSQVLRELAATAPASEQAALARSETDPASLARVATRAELRQPGTLERSFGHAGGGLGLGGMMAGTIFGSLVAGFVGSMVAQQFMEGMDAFGGDLAAEAEALSGDESFASSAEPMADAEEFDALGEGL